MEFITQQTQNMSLATAPPPQRVGQPKKYGQHKKNRRGGKANHNKQKQPGDNKENQRNGANARRRHRQHRGGGGQKRALAAAAAAGQPPPQGFYWVGYGGMPFQPAPGAYPNRTYVRPNVQAPPPWPGVFHAPPRAPAEEPGPSLCFTVGDTPAKAVVTPQRKPSSTICPTTCGPTPNSDAKLRRNLADVYASFDCVLMNHAIEVSERAAAARIQGPREEHSADAALAAAAAASADAALAAAADAALGDASSSER
jgi:hypothetical protein